jgi:3-methylcrotonyl-CoA carboxylase alpha subunit
MTSFQIQNQPNQTFSSRKQGNQVVVDGASVVVTSIDEHTHNAQIGSRKQRVYLATKGDTVFVQMNGQVCRLERVDPTRRNASAAAQQGGQLLAPMPGVVVSWLAQPGFEVKAGDPLLVIESMKLQMTISADIDGVVSDLPFNQGQSFQRGAVLARLQSKPTSGASE